MGGGFRGNGIRLLLVRFLTSLDRSQTSNSPKVKGCLVQGSYWDSLSDIPSLPSHVGTKHQIGTSNFILLSKFRIGPSCPTRWTGLLKIVGLGLSATTGVRRDGRGGDLLQCSAFPGPHARDHPHS